MEDMVGTRIHPVAPRTTSNRPMNITTHQHHRSGTPPTVPDSPTDLKDPVCGMKVTAQSAHTLKREGRPYYFCSAKCQGKFAANPLQYLVSTATAVSAPAAADTVYTCPMHPEIRQDHPGNCPKCGMTLEPLLPELEDDDNPELRDFQRRF